MTLIETRERIRKARNALEPLVSGTGKQFAKDMNDILNKLAELEGTVSYETPKTKV